MNPGVIVGDDGVARCPWGASTPEYRSYHDDEWGRPVADDKLVLELLCLEGFQSGLSWLTVLRKRPGFRKAFRSFDPDVVARFGDSDVERLLGDAAIIRHRGKIAASIANARATVALHDEGKTLAGLVWKFEPERDGTKVPQTMAQLASTTPESDALSLELRRHGFKFVGPTTVYSAMQSLGIVNDHMGGCELRKVAESERASFRLPE